MPNDQFYLKSEDEMRRIFANIPEACDNTAKIAQQCDVTFTFGEHASAGFPGAGGVRRRKLISGASVRKVWRSGMLRRRETEHGVA